MNKNVYEMVNKNTYENPNKTAIIFKDNEVTYSTVLKKSKILYYDFKKHDLNKKAIVLFLPRTEDLLVSILATFLTEGFFVPIDITYPKERIENMLALLDIGIIVTNKEYENELTDYSSKCIYIEDIYIYSSSSFDNIQIETSVDKIAYCIFTSGSTGVPKGVLIKEQSLLCLVKSFMDLIELSKLDTILCQASQCFDMFIVETIVSLTLGLTIVLTDENESKDPVELLKIIDKHHIEIVQMTPSKLKLIQMAEEIYSLHDQLKNVKVFIIGGEPFIPNIFDWLRLSSNAKIYNFYGPTEATVWATFKELSSSNNISLGIPLHGISYKIFSDKITEVTEPLSLGELYLYGNAISIGYVGREGLTKEKFIDIEGTIMYKTGDLVSIDKISSELIFVGRVDNQVSLNGFRVELEEIEKKVLEYDYIDLCVAGIIKDSTSSSVLYLCYKSITKIKNEEIKVFLEKSLPQYMIPTYFLQTNNFMYTLNGKVDRKSMDKLVTQRDLADYNNKDLSLLNRIANIVSSVSKIHIKKDDYDVDLKVLGLTSMNFFVIIVEIEKEFNINIDPRKLNFDKKISINILHSIAIT